MGNISKEERERRKAEAEAAVPETESKITTSPPVVEEAPLEEVKPVEAAKPEKKSEKNAYDVSSTDFAHFQKHILEEEKLRSQECVNQAVEDAKRVAADRIMADKVTKDLLADPGHIGKRKEFVDKYGPSKVKPPKPPVTAYGIKDPDLMRWMCRYEPEKYIETYKNSQSPLGKELLQLAKAAINAQS